MELKKLIANPSTLQYIVLRARMVVLASEEKNNTEIGRILGVSNSSPPIWFKRWQSLEHIPLEELSVLERLENAPRRGRFSKYSAEQVSQIRALACERRDEQGVE